MSASRPDDGGAERAVLAAHEAYYAAFEAGDVDAMGELWVPPALGGLAWVVHPGRPLIPGRERVLRSYAAAMAAATYLQFVVTDVRVQVSDGVAVVTCVENVLAAASDEAALAGGTLVATSVLRRVGERWRYLGHHASPVTVPS